MSNANILIIIIILEISFYLLKPCQKSAIIGRKKTDSTIDLLSVSFVINPKTRERRENGDEEASVFFLLYQHGLICFRYWASIFSFLQKMDQM